MTSYPKIPKSRVEIHVHLDGSFRPSTVFEYARKRNISLPKDCIDAESLKNRVQLDDGEGLLKLLESFNIMVPPIAGDLEAIERAAYEFVEDMSKNDVVYSEVRYSPHLLASSVENPEFTKPGNVTPKEVVEAVNRGLNRGQQEFEVKVRTILCCMRHRPEWSKEVLGLCLEFKKEGVVAIDIAGDERLANPTHELHVRVFEEANRLGINRTVHAAEGTCPENGVEALDRLHAQRLGHGYSCMLNPDVYKRVVENQTHFEMCPGSSMVTLDAETVKDPTRLPVRKFLEDGANVSISTDDPFVTGKYLSQEYEFLENRVLLPFKYVAKANLNAAKASFLPEVEKQELVKYISEIYKEYLI